MSKSEEYLKQAFAGESQANRRYLAFAKKADQAGLPQIARLFRAAAAAETCAAIEAGAAEVDVVFPYRALLDGDSRAGLDLVRACREACGGRALLKVILETGQLSSADSIRRAAQIAVDGGAQFLKTSTGKTQPGATPGAARVMLEVIAAAALRGIAVGFKASGGIRSIGGAEGYLGLWDGRFGAGSATAANFRIGASALFEDLLAAAAD